jgi:hypothetical protein
MTDKEKLKIYKKSYENSTCKDERKMLLRLIHRLETKINETNK